MTATWPGSLPQTPLPDNFNEALADNAVRFKPDVGPPKTRRRGTAAETPMQVTFYMHANQRADLTTFFRDTLLSGTLPFLWNDPITQVLSTFMFAAPPPMPVVGPTLSKVSLSLYRLA